MYNRLFTKILDSSIWLEADTTRLIWITFLASMDEDGFAPFSSVENLSRRANIPMDATVVAVKVLESPDKFNSNDEFHGCRIERVENGWLVLKASYYRGILTREIEREQNRIRVARHREKVKGVTNSPLHNITSVTGNAAEHSKAEQKKSSKPTRSEVAVFFANEIIAAEFWDYYESNGWRVGRNPMKDWKAAARRWKRGSQMTRGIKQPGATNLEAYKTPKFAPELTDEQISKNKEIIVREKQKLVRELSGKLAEQFKMPV